MIELVCAAYLAVSIPFAIWYFRKAWLQEAATVSQRKPTRFALSAQETMELMTAVAEKKGYTHKVEVINSDPAISHRIAYWCGSNDFAFDSFQVIHTKIPTNESVAVDRIFAFFRDANTAMIFKLSFDGLA